MATRGYELESLEHRTLLSATLTLQRGTLLVQGTDQQDSIKIRVLDAKGRDAYEGVGAVYKVIVWDGPNRDEASATITRIRFSRVRRITMELLGGDDNVELNGRPPVTGKHRDFRLGITRVPLRVNAGDGNDTIYGGEGPDTLRGGSGDDRLYTRSTVSRMFGGDGNDTLQGARGDDLLSGGTGDDAIYGGDGGDRIYGGPGNDKIVVLDTTPDIIRSGKGHDQIFSDGGIVLDFDAILDVCMDQSFATVPCV